MRRKRWAAALLAMTLLLVGLPPALAAEPETAKARVVFAASEPDADGRFALTLKAYNIKFNGFQFVLRYDQKTVKPIAKGGGDAGSFHDFCILLGQENKWMSTIGTEIDAEQGLIDFSGYVTPGQNIAVDAEPIKGFAAIGATGLALMELHFQKLGDQPINLELATEGGPKPYRSYMPNGGGMYDTGFEVPAEILIELPKTIGTSTERDPVEAPTQLQMTREQRLKDTVVLQVGNSHASVSGVRTAIYKDEPNVTAYAADNRTYVPVRFIAEQMGAKVDWEQKTATVVITKDEKVIRMPLDSKTYTVDGVSKEMDVTPQLKGEPGSATQRTMVPIRFVAEALKMDVQWDKGSNTVIIAPASAPWDLKGTVEQGILMDTLLILSPLVETVVGT